MKKTLLFISLLITTFSFSQTQIGLDIDGEAAHDVSGRSISLSSDGSIVAIGASNNNGNGFETGHVRVYENIGGIWTQIGSDIDGEVANDLSGNSVSLSSDGSIVAIGALRNDENGNSARGLAEVIIAKHRNGPLGTVHMRYEASFTKFSDHKQQEEGTNGFL